jgi:hypothetical protein
VNANMNAPLYTKKERDTHTVCKRCKTQALVSCSKEDHNIFSKLSSLYTVIKIEKQHLIFLQPISAYLHAPVFFCVSSCICSCMGYANFDLHGTKE